METTLPLSRSPVPPFSPSSFLPYMMRRFAMTLILLAICGCATLPRDVFYPLGLPEARTIDYRDPASYPAANIPANVPPYTVANIPPKDAEWQLSLDDAIRIALENAKAVRVLAGTTAVASGKTIYDAAIRFSS